jgi:hypothetical protein
MDAVEVETNATIGVDGLITSLTTLHANMVNGRCSKHLG